MSRTASAAPGWSRSSSAAPAVGAPSCRGSSPAQLRQEQLLPRRAPRSARPPLAPPRLGEGRRSGRSALDVPSESERGGRVCGGSKEGACWDHQLSGRKAREVPAEADGGRGAPQIPQRAAKLSWTWAWTWQWLPKMPASSFLGSAPKGAWRPFAQLVPSCFQARR